MSGLSDMKQQGTVLKQGVLFVRTSVTALPLLQP